MKKFLLLAFFLLAGVTTTSAYADDAVAPADFAVVSNEGVTLKWSIEGGAGYIALDDIIYVDGFSGGGTVNTQESINAKVTVVAAEGYRLKSWSVGRNPAGNEITVDVQVEDESLMTTSESENSIVN